MNKSNEETCQLCGMSGPHFCGGSKGMSNLPESYSKSVRSDSQDRVREATFEEALTNIINRYSKENGSNTPDFLLARYLNNCLLVFNSMTQAREAWYGRDAHPDESKDLTQLLSPSLKTDQDKGAEG